MRCRFPAGPPLLQEPGAAVRSVSSRVAARPADRDVGDPDAGRAGQKLAHTALRPTGSGLPGPSPVTSGAERREGFGVRIAAELGGSLVARRAESRPAPG